MAERGQPASSLCVRMTQDATDAPDERSFNEAGCKTNAYVAYIMPAMVRE